MSAQKTGRRAQLLGIPARMIDGSTMRHHTDMKTIFVILFATALLGGCGTSSTNRQARQANAAAAIPAASGIEQVETRPDGTSTAGTVEGYKRDLAQRISQVNSTKVYAGRPQAMLRSVVVVKYIVDARGNLVRSEIMRSNRDRATESIALASVKSTAPFPKPLPHLLRQGRLEISETWLFNTDGRFQLRTIAEPQMNE
jgi:protein TonB